MKLEREPRPCAAGVRGAVANARRATAGNRLLAASSVVLGTVIAVAAPVAIGDGAVFSVYESEIHSVDVATGKATLLTTIPGTVDGISTGGAGNSLASDPDNRLLYYAAAQSGSGRNALFGYDLDDDRHFVIDPDLPGRHGMEVDPDDGLSSGGAGWADGSLYIGIEDSPDRIYRIDFVEGSGGREVAGATLEVEPTDNDFGDLAVIGRQLYLFSRVDPPWLQVYDLDLPPDADPVAKLDFEALNGVPNGQLARDFSGQLYNFSGTTLQRMDTSGVLQGTRLDATTDGTSVLPVESYDAAGYVPPAGTIAGLLLDDANGNGTEDVEERGVSGVTLELFDDVDGDGVVDSGERRLAIATTDIDGRYAVDELLPGEYLATVTDANAVLAEASLTTGASERAVALGADAVRRHVDDVDFGYQGLTVTFVERSEAVGLEHAFMAGLDWMTGSFQIFDWSQSGMAIGDIDGDDDLDVIACGGVRPNTVWRNDGDTFTDITDHAGINAGELDRVAALGDYDDDGDLDLWLGALEYGEGPTVGGSRLYRNDGTGRFEDVTALAGTTGAGHSIHAKWADVNLDGWVDLYVSEFHSTRNLLYRNNGDGTFTEIGASAGADAPGSAHVTGIVDADRDGYPDLFVGNDWRAGQGAGQPGNAGDFELHGDGRGFVDVTVGSGTELDSAVMGMAFGDVDYDGWIDVYKADAEDNHLLVNRGWPGSGRPWINGTTRYDVPGAVVPNIEEPGVIGPAISWAAIFMDADLDRWLDLFVANGKVAGPEPDRNIQPVGQQNYFYKGAGPDSRFVDETALSGLLVNVDDRAAAAGDLDGDGDVDLLVGATNGRMRYYENQAETLGRNWLVVRPTCLTSASGCSGTRVSWVDSLGNVHLRVLGADAPTASENDDRSAYFGLGPETEVDLTVQFPSGLKLSLPATPANAVVRPVEPQLYDVPPTVPRSRGGEPDELTVTVYAHDTAAQALGPDATVTIELPGWTPVGDVEHVVDNVFERRFQVPSTAGGYTLQASFDGVTPRVQPSVRVVDGPSATRSDLAVTPEGVRAGTGDTFAVTVALKDVQGVSAGAGFDLTARVDGRDPTTVEDLGDGRYRMTFDAPAQAGTYPVEIWLDGAPTGVGSLVIEAAAAAVEASTEVYEEVPLAVHSTNPHLLKLLVTPRDLDGRRLGPGAEVEVEIVPDPDTAPVSRRQDVRRLGRSDGSFPLVLEKHATVVRPTASGLLRIQVDGAVVLERPYAF